MQTPFPDALGTAPALSDGSLPSNYAASELAGVSEIAGSGGFEHDIDNVLAALQDGTLTFTTLLLALTNPSLKDATLATRVTLICAAQYRFERALKAGDWAVIGEGDRGGPSPAELADAVRRTIDVTWNIFLYAEWVVDRNSLDFELMTSERISPTGITEMLCWWLLTCVGELCLAHIEVPSSRSDGVGGSGSGKDESVNAAVALSEAAAEDAALRETRHFTIHRGANEGTPLSLRDIKRALLAFVSGMRALGPENANAARRYVMKLFTRITELTFSTGDAHTFNAPIFHSHLLLPQTPGGPLVGNGGFIRETACIFRAVFQRLNDAVSFDQRAFPAHVVETDVGDMERVASWFCETYRDVDEDVIMTVFRNDVVKFLLYPGERARYLFRNQSAAADVPAALIIERERNHEYEELLRHRDRRIAEIFWGKSGGGASDGAAIAIDAEPDGVRWQRVGAESREMGNGTAWFMREHLTMRVLESLCYARFRFPLAQLSVIEETDVRSRLDDLFDTRARIPYLVRVLNTYSCVCNGELYPSESSLEAFAQFVALAPDEIAGASLVGIKISLFGGDKAMPDVAKAEGYVFIGGGAAADDDMPSYDDVIVW